MWYFNAWNINLWAEENMYKLPKVKSSTLFIRYGLVNKISKAVLLEGSLNTWRLSVQISRVLSSETFNLKEWVESNFTLRLQSVILQRGYEKRQTHQLEGLSWYKTKFTRKCKGLRRGITSWILEVKQIWSKYSYSSCITSIVGWLWYHNLPIRQRNLCFIP